MIGKTFWRYASVAGVWALASCGGDGGGNPQLAQAPGGGGISTSPTPTPSPSPTPTPAPTTSTDVDVILVMGQSNATGYQADTSTDYVPQQGILAWTGSALTRYAPNSFTGIESQAPAGYWAAELSYAQQYRAAYPGRTLVILRYTAAGTQLAYSGSAAVLDWNPQSTGELLDGARAFVRTALATLRAGGMTPHLRLIWWQQGENDALGALGATYASNLAALMAALRDPAGDFAVPATTPIAIGRLSSSVVALYGTSATQVRAAETSVAHADVGGPQVLLDDDDLPLESGIHFSKPDQLTLGYRLWQIDQGSYPEP